MTFRGWVTTASTVPKVLRCRRIWARLSFSLIPRPEQAGKSKIERPQPRKNPLDAIALGDRLGIRSAGSGPAADPVAFLSQELLEDEQDIRIIINEEDVGRDGRMSHKQTPNAKRPTEGSGGVQSLPNRRMHRGKVAGPQNQGRHNCQSRCLA